MSFSQGPIWWMWNLFPPWIHVSFFKQKQGGCKSFCISDHLSYLLQMHFNKHAPSESNILSPFVNSLLNARLKIANSLNWKCSFCEEKPASTKGFNYWQTHLTTFFNKLSHITLIPENLCAFFYQTMCFHYGLFYDDLYFVFWRYAERWRLSITHTLYF